MILLIKRVKMGLIHFFLNKLKYSTSQPSFLLGNVCMHRLESHTKYAYVGDSHFKNQSLG